MIRDFRGGCASAVDLRGTRAARLCTGQKTGLHPSSPGGAAPPAAPRRTVRDSTCSYQHGSSRALPRLRSALQDGLTGRSVSVLRWHAFDVVDDHVIERLAAGFEG